MIKRKVRELDASKRRRIRQEQSGPVADAMLPWLIEQRQEGARGFRHGQSDPLTVVGPQLLELAPGVRQATGFGHAHLEASLVATVFVGTRLARQPSSLDSRRKSFAC